MVYAYRGGEADRKSFYVLYDWGHLSMISGNSKPAINISKIAGICYLSLYTGRPFSADDFIKKGFDLKRPSSTLMELPSDSKVGKLACFEFIKKQRIFKGYLFKGIGELQVRK